MLNILYSHGATDVKFPEPQADGDIFALLIVLVVIAAFTVWVIISKRKKNAPVAEEVTDAPVRVSTAPDTPKAPGAAGQLKLHNVEPKTAAMVMAIVADKMGKPLNELRFISIKEVE